MARIGSPDGFSDLFFRLIWAISIRLLSFLPVLSIISALLLLLIRYNGIGVEIISILFLFFLFSILISVIGIMVWQVGRGVKSLLKRYWELQTPEHNIYIRDLSIGTVPEVVDYILPTPYVESPTERETHSPYYSTIVGLVQLLYGFFTLVLGTSILVVITINGWSDLLREFKVQNASFLSAFVSVLLGPILGIITLSLATVLSRASDILLMVLLILLPSLFIVPSMRNITVALDSFYTNSFSRLNSQLEFHEWTISVISALFATIHLLLMYILYDVYRSLI